MDKDNDYRIENLAFLFEKHAEQADFNHQQFIKKYREDFPDSELPEHLSNEFNIARALSVMAAEIEKLKMICK